MGQLKKIMADVLRMPEEEVTDDLSIKDTDKWDSLKHMELVVTIEQTFGIRLTANEIVSMVNMSEIKRVLKNKGVETLL